MDSQFEENKPRFQYDASGRIEIVEPGRDSHAGTEPRTYAYQVQAAPNGSPVLVLSPPSTAGS